MTTAAARAQRKPAPGPPRETPEAVRPRRQARARPRVTGGVVWVLIVGTLLAGIVALNVAVLGRNMQVEQLEGEREKLRAENALLSSELSSASAAGRIEAIATRRLGLGAPVETTYVRLEPREP